VPELRIIDQGLWDQVTARQQRTNKDQTSTKIFAFRERRRIKYLFSGLTQCACAWGGLRDSAQRGDLQQSAQHSA
jgi:site-specific DNA recombinase